MSAFILKTQALNQIADSILYHAEYGSHDSYSIKQASIHVLDTLRISWGYHVGNFEAQKALSKKLFVLNFKAVKHRYSHFTHDDFKYSFGLYEGYKPKTSFPIRIKHQFLKSVHCFLYQCCEGDYDETPLYKALEKLAAAIEHDIVTGMDEYDQASWG